MARLFSRTLRRLGAACSVLAPLAGLLAGGGLAQAQTSYSSGYWYGNASPVSVLTHHNDGWRTGWNYAETTLTPSNVAATGGSKLFGLQGSVDLDGLVEVQPLVVPNAYVYGDPNAGRHDVVYLATANNTVYAIDPTTRKVLRSRNLGTPMSAFPGCEDNDKIIGVNSTPVIDPSTNSLYLIAHVRVGSGSAVQVCPFQNRTVPLSPTAQAAVGEEPAMASSGRSALVGGWSGLSSWPSQRHRVGLLGVPEKSLAGAATTQASCSETAQISRGFCSVAVCTTAAGQKDPREQAENFAVRDAGNEPAEREQVGRSPQLAGLGASQPSNREPLAGTAVTSTGPVAS